MKKNTFHAKKVLVALFAVLMPLVASAEKVEIDGIWYNLVSKVKQAEVTYKGEYSHSYDEYSGSITVPATVTYEGVDYSVTSIGGSAFYYCSSLTAINIPEGVTSIGDKAFYECSSLTAINIPENSQLTSIGEYAFTKCSSLTAITIPENSQLTSIGSSAFENCSSLTAITLPEGVTSIGNYAFLYCRSLTTITIPEGVTSIGEEAFSGCSSLTDVTLPEGVTSIGSYAFRGCSSLTAVHISSIEAWCKISFYNYDSNPLFYAHNLYLNGELVTNLVIPEGVTSIGKKAFLSCSSLTAINIPENSKLTSIGEAAFDGCSSLTTVVLPKNLKYIGSQAFANCPELTDVYCYAEKVPSTYYNAFDGSYPEYATLHVPAGAIESYKATAPWSNFGKFETTSIAVESITLSQSTATLTEGETLVLTAMVTPDDAADKSISWSSSNPSVATVDNTGKVTAVAPGTATITAMANDGSGVSASCEVTVLPAEYILTAYIDGEVFVTDTLARGTIITLPDYPTKEGYTFSGWGEVPETMPAHDVTINATFIPNKYLVTFKIGDEVIASDSLEYGAAIVAPDAPEKEGYTFNGWGDVAETVPAGDVTYEGGYTINSYLLTYTVDGEVVQADSVVYGSAITALDEPNKEGYTFSGWIGVPETMPAYDVTINGAFTINKYLVTFKIGDEVIASDSLEYGAAIVAPDVPEKEGYTFNGWGDVAETVPAGDVTYEGSYTVNVYNVYYYVGEELVHTAEVAYGEAIPEYIYEPTEEGCTFLGWVGESYDAMPAHDVTYTANIDNGIDQFIIDNSQLIIYDLTGRRVLNTENLKGGIYIVNGRKVIVK